MKGVTMRIFALGLFLFTALAGCAPPLPIADYVADARSPNAKIITQPLRFDVITVRVKALEKIALLSSSSGTRQPLKERNTNRDNRPPDRHYCWTHGYLCEHTSGRCPEPGPGHQKFATARKPSGGSQKRKDEWIQRVTRVEA